MCFYIGTKESDTIIEMSLKVFKSEGNPLGSFSSLPISVSHPYNYSGLVRFLRIRLCIGVVIEKADNNKR